MARRSASNSRVYLDAMDLSGLSNQFDVKFNNTLPEDTAFSDGADTFVEGKYGHSATINCFDDMTLANWDQVAFALLGAGDHYFGGYPGSLAAPGDVGYELIQEAKAEPRTAQVKSVIMAHFEGQGSARSVKSTVLVNGVVVGTGAVAGSAQNLGATISGDSLVVVMRALAVSGAGSITVTVEQSNDNGGTDPYTLVTGFTHAFTGTGVFRATIAGVTKAWKRVNVTAFSGFTSVTVMVAVGKEK